MSSRAEKKEGGLTKPRPCGEGCRGTKQAGKSKQAFGLACPASRSRDMGELKSTWHGRYGGPMGRVWKNTSNQKVSLPLCDNRVSI